MKTFNPIAVAKNILLMVQFAVIMRYEKLGLLFGSTAFKPSHSDYYKFIETCRTVSGKTELCEGVTAKFATMSDAQRAYKAVPQVDLDQCPPFRTEFIGCVWTRKDKTKTFLYRTLPEVDVTRSPIEMDAAHVLYEALVNHRPFSVEEANLLLHDLTQELPRWTLTFDQGVTLCHTLPMYEDHCHITSICRLFDGKVHLVRPNGVEMPMNFEQLPTRGQGMVFKRLLEIDTIREFAARLKPGYSDEEIADAFKSLVFDLSLREHKMGRRNISDEEFDWEENTRLLFNRKIIYIQGFLRHFDFDAKMLKVEEEFDSPYAKHLLDQLGKGLNLIGIKKLDMELGEPCLLLSYKDADGEVHEYEIFGADNNTGLIENLYNFILDVEDHMPLYYEIIGDTLMSTLE